MDTDRIRRNCTAWSRMAFKPRKSRSLIIKKGKITEQFQLMVQGEKIPFIIGNPMKCLWKWYDETLCDRTNISRIGQQVSEGMRNIDKTCIPGKFKAWIYQHGLLLRIAWPLLLYEITVTRTINKHLRKWLGVPPSFGLYSRTSKLQLPFTSLVEEYKVGKARLVMTPKDSKDEKVRGYPEIVQDPQDCLSISWFFSFHCWFYFLTGYHKTMHGVHLINIWSILLCISFTIWSISRCQRSSCSFILLFASRATIPEYQPLGGTKALARYVILCLRHRVT